MLVPKNEPQKRTLDNVRKSRKRSHIDTDICLMYISRRGRWSKRICQYMQKMTSCNSGPKIGSNLFRRYPWCRQVGLLDAIDLTSLDFSCLSIHTDGFVVSGGAWEFLLVPLLGHHVAWADVRRRMRCHRPVRKNRENGPKSKWTLLNPTWRGGGPLCPPPPG